MWVVANLGETCAELLTQFDQFVWQLWRIFPLDVCCGRYLVDMVWTSNEIRAHFDGEFELDLVCQLGPLVDP